MFTIEFEIPCDHKMTLNDVIDDKDLDKVVNTG